MLTDKSKEDRLRRWTLKRFLVIFGQNLICESILVLVLLWLLSQPTLRREGDA